MYTIYNIHYKLKEYDTEFTRLQNLDYAIYILT